MGKEMGMMNSGCLLDSDILIYHLNGDLDDSGERLFSDMLKQGAHISIISRIEIMGWRGHITRSDIT